MATPLRSDRTIVGASAWSIRLYPSDGSCTKNSLPDATGVYVHHHFLSNQAENQLTEIRAVYEICVLGGESGDNVQLKHKSPKEGSLFDRDKNCNGKTIFKHEDIWGASPTLQLHDDTLQLRVNATYSPPKLTALDRINPVGPLQKKCRRMHDSEIGKDFVLVSSDGTKRSAHRALLDKSSPFFSAMFHSGMKETKLKQCVMSDISSETLDILLRFMYYDCTEGLKTSARTVIVAADKYQMADLKKSCEDILAAELSNETAADLLLLADKVSASILKDGALRHIATNFKAMEKSDEINKLLNDGHNNLTREIFTAVTRWGITSVK